MIDKLGLPTVFFTHSAADGQWPELARLICKDSPENSSSHSKAINENPAVADWFFYERISKFVETYYKNILGATDYWFRFQWQHRGSPHVHGLAWLPNAPDAEKLLSCDDSSQLLDVVDEVIAYVDMLHQPFRQLEDLLAGYQSHEDAYAAFLKSEKAPISLADNIQQLEMAQKEKCVNDDNEVRDDMYTSGYHGYKILARGEK